MPHRRPVDPLVWEHHHLHQQPFDQEAEASGSSPAQDDKYFSRAEAARYVGVPTSTIYHWARAGRLRCIVTLGGHMRFSQNDLDAARPGRIQPSGRASSSPPDEASPPSPPASPRSPDGLDG